MTRAMGYQIFFYYQARQLQAQPWLRQPSKTFLSKGAILTWAGGGGGRPSLAPGEEWLLRISPPQNGGIGGTMAL